MDKINQLIDLNIKIEGLLRVLVNRDSEAAENALDDCINEFNAIYDSIKVNPEQPEEDAIISPEPSPIVETNPISESDEEEVKTESETEPEITIEDDDVEETQPIEATVEDVIEEQQSDEELPADESEAEATDFEIEDEPEDESAETSDNIKVDEMISRQEASDLKKAFTINDKFRFRRELFGGSEENFIDTINLIIAMNSFDEVKEYLFEDLNWDKNNEDVADFMTIIAKHFNV